jgi:hypothetical protein
MMFSNSQKEKEIVFSRLSETTREWFRKQCVVCWGGRFLASLLLVLLLLLAFLGL